MRHLSVHARFPCSRIRENASIAAAIAIFVLSGMHPPAAAQEQAKEAAALYTEAAALQNAGKFSAALAKWQHFVKQHPQDPAVGLAYQALGTCSHETGAYEQAIDAFGQALKNRPEGEPAGELRWNLALAWQRRAEESKKAEHQRKLVEALQAVLADKDTRKDWQALAGFYLARAELVLGNGEAARKRLQALVTNVAEPSILAAARLALAHLEEDSHAWPAAAKWYADFLRHHPDDKAVTEARLGLAEAHFHQKHWQEAEAEFADLKKAASGSAAEYAYFRWSELPSLRGDAAASARRIERFVAEHPASGYRARGLRLAGGLFYELSEYPKAIAAWESLLRDFPKDVASPAVRLRLGWALVKDGKHERAEAHFKTALDEELPDDERRSALWGWARCADGKKNATEAVRRFALLVELPGQGADGDQALYDAVTAAATAKDIKSATGWSDQLIERFPMSAWTAHAQLQAARAQADVGEYEPAWQRSRWLLDTPVKELQEPALYLAGFCALKARKFKEAIPFFEKLRDEHRDSAQTPTAMYSLGVSFESMGATAKALAAYQDFLKQHAKHPLAAEASRRVRILQMP